MNGRYDEMYAAAERHYLRGETMESIAHTLGVSRSTVSRLLTQAREEGIVQISLAQRGSQSPLARELTETYGPAVHLVQVPDSAAPGARFEQVGRRAAQLMGTLVTEESRIGVAWGVTVAAVVRYLERRPVPGVKVVQMNGSGNAADSAVPYVGAILAAVADAYGGQVIPFPIPAFFDHAETRAALWRESMIQHVLNEQAHLDLAIFGVGSLYGSVPSRVYSTGYLASDTLAMLERQGVVGDISTVLLREDGSYADIPLNAHATGMNPEQLRQVPRRLCVVADPQRAAAVVGALRAGVATDLVCDEATARAVLRRGKLVG